MKVSRYSIKEHKVLEKEFCTIKELSKLLGVSEFWIKRRVKTNEIPSYKLGRKRLFKEEEVRNWIESHKDKRCEE